MSIHIAKELWYPKSHIFKEKKKKKELTLSRPWVSIGTYRFYSVKRQTILLVNGEPFGQERVNIIKNYVPI